MIDTFKNKSCKFKSFFLNLLADEFHNTKHFFIPEHITDMIYYIHRYTV